MKATWPRFMDWVGYGIRTQSVPNYVLCSCVIYVLFNIPSVPLWSPRGPQILTKRRFVALGILANDLYLY